MAAHALCWWLGLVVEFSTQTEHAAVLASVTVWYGIQLMKKAESDMKETMQGHKSTWDKPYI